MEKRRSITRGTTEGKSQRTSRFPYMETRHVDVWSVHQRVLMLGGGPLNLTSSTRTESSNDLERLQTAHSVRILPYDLSTGSGTRVCCKRVPISASGPFTPSR